MPNNPSVRKASSNIVAKRDGAFIPIGQHNVDSTISTSTELFPETQAGLLDELEDQVNCILIQASGRDVRYTLSPLTPPTASVGFLLTAGASPILIYLPQGCQFRVIETAASASVQYQYGRVVER